MPETSASPITSVTARVQYKGEYLEFTGYPVEGSNVIEIQFPWYYPIDSDNLLPPSVMTEAKVTAVLANNVVITEPITVMDLTAENHITVIDQVKQSHDYIITGKITKLNLCDILEFTLSEELGLSTVVKDEASAIAILTDGAVGKGMANVVISPHATISPDPRVEEVDFDDPELVFTVKAHNGKDKRVYSVIKEIPPKRQFGLRPGSGKVVFAKQLYGEVGIPVADKTTGLAVSGNNLIINTQGLDPVVLDRYNGQKVGSMALDALTAAESNYYATSDDDGNIIFFNLTDAENTDFKMWVSKDVNSAPVEYLSWNAAGATYGKKVSVSGSLNKNAVIAAPVIVAGGASFARWTVTGGALDSAEPEIITITDIAPWTWNIDICYSGDTPDSDYFCHGYSGIKLSWVSGSNNTVKAATDAMNVNFVPNAVDVITFNRGTYIATNQVNGQTWGGADYAWLVEVSNVDNFIGTLDADHNADKVSDKSPAIFWQSDWNTYGARKISGIDGASYIATSNSQNFSDVILAPSTENDYYMYMYFMFCNGYVVGVQFDCLDM